MRKELQNVLLGVYDVVVLREASAKAERIDECLRDLAHVEILFLLLYELNAMQTSQITYVTGELGNIQKQLGGWRKSLVD